MNKVTLKDKLGYGSASIGDAVAYTLINTFLLFFLTTVAGIQPAMAGTLTIIGAIWNSILNPIIGYLSDHSKSKHGRRRPYIIGFAIPTAIALGLLFSSVHTTETIKVIYYGLMIIAFWTSYTGYFVPYYALGAEYSSNYEDQTSIRSFASFFNIIGSCSSMGLPPILVSIFEGQGISTEWAWTITASLLGIFCAVSIIITGVMSKDKDKGLQVTEDEGPKKPVVRSMVSEYKEVLKLKPMIWLLLCALFYLVAFAMFVSDLVYFLTFNIGLSSTGISGGLLFRSLISMIIIFPVAMLCRKTDKRTALLIIVATGCTGCVLMRFLPVHGIALMLLVILFSAIVSATYWQIVPALFYDMCEYDEVMTGNKRQGAILSVQGLVEAIASGIGTQILGIILQFGGFDGSSATQSESALSCIFSCVTIVPVLFMVLAALALYKYPITRKFYEEMIKNKAA